MAGVISVAGALSSWRTGRLRHEPLGVACRLELGRRLIALGLLRLMAAQGCCLLPGEGELAYLQGAPCPPPHKLTHGLLKVLEQVADVALPLQPPPHHLYHNLQRACRAGGSPGLRLDGRRTQLVCRGWRRKVGQGEGQRLRKGGGEVEGQGRRWGGQRLRTWGNPRRKREGARAE